MTGRFNQEVVHLPSGKRGKIVMNPSDAIGIYSTTVQFDDGSIQEIPDSEISPIEAKPSRLTGIRFASSRPIPAGMMLQLWNHGNGTVTVLGQIPGKPPVTLGNLPVTNGEIVLPDELFFPSGSVLAVGAQG